MIDKEQRKEIAKKHIERIVDRLDEQSLAARKDKQRLDEWEIQLAFDYSITADINLYGGDLNGYASQIIYHDGIRNSDNALRFLQANRLLNRPIVAKWFETFGISHHALTVYIETLDYLRLLIIEFIGLYQDVPEKHG